MPEIFLNCDLGEWESSEQTTALMLHIHMANISCGGHAGSAESIKLCAKIAEEQKPIAVSTGAHPGVLTGDRGRSLPEGFTLGDFDSLLELQIQRYIGGADLNHIKLHGALYHLVEDNEEFRHAFLSFVRRRCLISIVCLAGGKLAKEAEQRDMPIIPEVFLDRNYTAEGSLLSREHPHAIIDSPSEVEDRLSQLLHTNSLTAYDGSKVKLPSHYSFLTACVHSDSAHSLEILQAARSYLDTNG